MKLEIEYGKEFGGCTPDGCSTPLPVTIILNGMRLSNDKLKDGEFFSRDIEEDRKICQQWIDTVIELEDLVSGSIP